MSLFYAHIKELAIKPTHNRNWLDFMEKNEGKDVIVDIKRTTGTRSIRQGSYYWGVILPTIANHTGHADTELHEIFKRMFLPPKFITYTNKEYKLPGNTSSLDKVAFGEYCDRIIAEAAGMGIVVPLPPVKDESHKPIENYPQLTKMPTI